MGKAPAFQLYASDFYVDTNSWTIDELGIYTRLLLSEWVNGGLPNEENRLARIAGCGVKRFLAGWSQVQVKFHLNGKGTYINDRLEEEREKQAKFKELQSVRGKKSAEKRWGAPITTVITTVEPALQPDCNSSVFSLQSSTSKIKEKEYSPIFLQFWEIYPKKDCSKKSAFTEWEKARKNCVLPGIEIILEAVSKQITYKQALSDANQFCPEWPDAERWIKKARWEDQLKEVNNASPYGVH